MGAKKIQGRHELKYIINYFDHLELSLKLRTVLKSDNNSNEKGIYKIRSLYFDNYMDKALKEKVDGLNHREKFRIRYYNDNIDFIRLEKKSKINGICYKVSEKITYDECNKLLSGDKEFLKNPNKPLFIELYTKMMYQNLLPKNIVDYTREAYIYNAGNVRITIDSDIRSSNNIKDFFNFSLPTVQILNARILEVKYDNYLSDNIKFITGLKNRQVTSFSKYSNTRINY